jgi:uncharacterized protein
MNQLNTPLTDAEMDELDAFLHNRGHEAYEAEHGTGDYDEGILDISELDGFLTAIVSGPEMILPSRWIPEVWGDVEPEWETAEAFERIFTMMNRHMNGIVAALMDPDFEFEPIFLEHEVEGKRHLIVDEWCVGYMKGVNISLQSWQDADDEIAEQLGAILLFAGETGWKILKDLPIDEVVKLQDVIPGAVRHIHSYWLEQRRDEPSSQPVVRGSSKVGRNDPCPCGSGKKFKKCCLH